MEDQNKSVDKKDRDRRRRSRRRRYRRGKVYGGEVKEHEEEDTKHINSLDYSMCLLKSPREQLIATVKYLKRYAKDTGAKYSNTQRN
ncbi:MAG TPA: hypothetical protein VKA98_08180 [Nitrososphaeraceae archaeon]|nr:hypothetical protein [Nitrososphaeraceae archaeon]